MNKKQKKLVLERYNDILTLVENGSNISDAVAKFKICRNSFYYNITAIQKQELLAAKALHTKYGQGSLFGDWNTKTKNKKKLMLI